MRKFQSFAAAWVVAWFALGLGAPAKGEIVYNEAVNGDASGNYQMPTAIPLSAGINSVLLSTGFDDFGNFDLDYIRVELPAGGMITAINLPSYVDGNVSFMGFQAAAAMSFDPEANDFACVAECLGFGHFGFDNIGTNLFPALQSFMLTNGAAGVFSTPLAAPQYTFWLQETALKSSYQLDFIVEIPEPTGAVLLTLAGCFGLLQRRRRSEIGDASR